jgi:hypothetical protein
VLAEYERTGDYGPVEDFVRRFKADEAAAPCVALSGNIKGLGS